jgi:hypothetical protein
MRDTNNSGRRRRVVAVLAVLLAAGIAALWLAGPGFSTRGDLRTWLQSAVSMPERPSPRGFEDVVARVKPAVFGIRAKVMDAGASTDDRSLAFSRGSAKHPTTNRQRRSIPARQPVRGPASSSALMATPSPPIMWSSMAHRSPSRPTTAIPIRQGSWRATRNPTLRCSRWMAALDSSRSKSPTRRHASASG